MDKIQCDPSNTTYSDNYFEIKVFEKGFKNILFLYYFLDLKIAQNPINSEL